LEYSMADALRQDDLADSRAGGQPRDLPGRVWSLVLMFAAVVLVAPQAEGEDTVVAASASDPMARVKRTGQILEYTGNELKLRTSLGLEETIPAGRVIEIQATWNPSHQAGDVARAKGELDEAIAAFRQAKAEERRPWARRRIAAELAGAYLEAGRIESAGDEFLAIVASDPATRHYDIVPIAWRPAPPDAAIERHAAAWLAKGQSPPARVLGASWLLAGPRRTEAIATLEELVKASDPRVAGLATIQLWRTKLVTAKPADLAIWQAQLEKMPREIQAAGWYVLGDVHSRQNQPEQAALAYLKVPLLHRRQRAMAANALLAAGKQLEKMGQKDQAAGLYREIARDFAHLPAAKEPGRPAP
jgi:tetratricopeptide (TPR) repeat protein